MWQQNINMIKTATLKTLEKAINFALSLDEQSKERIQRLHGKRLKMIIKPLGVVFYITFTEHALVLQSSMSEAVDTVIESSPLGLIRLSFLPQSQVRSLFNDKIRMSGDVELGQDLKRLIDDLDIDWEGHLAQLTGDVVAHQIGSFVKKGKAWGGRFTNSLNQSMTEYLQEELSAFPPKEAVEDFYRDLGDLLLSVERFEAKLNYMKAENEDI